MPESQKEGLTKPLVNNVGGVIDQDAPSADQLMGRRGEESLDDTLVERGAGDKEAHETDRVNDGVMPFPMGKVDPGEIDSDA